MAAGSTCSRASCGGSRPTARCRTWAGTACSTAAPCGSSRGSEDGAHFYFVHSYYPVVASGASTGRDVGGLAQEGSGSDTPDSGLGSSRASLSGVVRLRGSVCGGHRDGAHLRDAVSSREEPALGHPPARELRGAREGQPVIVIPAVDLRGGRCVRLREGRADAETVFSDDPVAMAERWVDAGAERLHVVDLDGAFAGAPRQTALIAKIVEAVRPVPVEAGGGLRDLAALQTRARDRRARGRWSARAPRSTPRSWTRRAGASASGSSWPPTPAATASPSGLDGDRRPHRDRARPARA